MALKIEIIDADSLAELKEKTDKFMANIETYNHGEGVIDVMQISLTGGRAGMGYALAILVDEI